MEDVLDQMSFDEIKAWKAKKTFDMLLRIPWAAQVYSSIRQEDSQNTQVSFALANFRF